MVKILCRYQSVYADISFIIIWASSIDAINVTAYSLYNQGLKMLLLSIPKKEEISKFVWYCAIIADTNTKSNSYFSQKLKWFSF